jgi:YihY family inner membrane protein
VNPLERGLRAFDRAQQRFPVAAFLFAVNKKYGDDNGGNLATLLTYNAFLALFPLLLVLVTVLGLVAGGSSSITHRILHSALRTFPIIGTDLARNIHALHRNSLPGLVIGVLGLLWGSLGAAQTGQYAMAEIWNVPKLDRPGFLPRLGRSVGLLLALFVFLVVGTGLSGVAAATDRLGVPLRVLGALASLLVDIGLFLVAYRLLTPKGVRTRQLLPGSLIAGVAWAVLQAVGTLVVTRDLRGASAVYGFFAIVLGALAWIYLIMRVVIYAAEANVVLDRHLWPRSLVQPPLTPVDRQMLVTYVHQERRRPEVVTSAVVACPPSETPPPPADPSAPEPSS